MSDDDSAFRALLHMLAGCAAGVLFGVPLGLLIAWIF